VTLSRLFPSTPGPGSPTAYAGPYQAAVSFKTLGPEIQWLQAYFAWVPPGGDLLANKCALYQGLSAVTGALIPGTVVTSGTLTAGAWNLIPLPSPVPLSAGTPYTAARGWTAVNGFPFTASQFGATQPFASGFTSGSLFAYSDATGGGTPGTSNPAGLPQGSFSSISADPVAQLADQGSLSSNFWTDILVSDAAPSGYAGTYELNPSNVNGNLSAVLDLNVNYNVGTEFALAAAPGVAGYPVPGIKYLSPPGAASLATRASIWSISGGGLVRAEVAGAALAAPSWSGGAGSGWVTALFAVPPVLPPGKYVAAVYNSNGTGGLAPGLGPGWNAKDSITGGYGPGGDFTAGITNGPLSAPGLAAASTCYDYDGSAAGATPPFSAGTTEPGQCCFGQMPDGSLGPPYLYAGPSQNYFVSPVIGQPVMISGASTPDIGDRSSYRRVLIW